MAATSSIDRIIGAKVHEKRIALGLDLAALAAALSLSEFQLAQIERGSVRITAMIMLKLCRRFGVRSNYFFDGWEIAPRDPHRRTRPEAASSN